MLACDIVWCRILLHVYRQTFQYFGLDFLLDCECHPWLMEVNATPSMKVAHEAAHTEQLIQQQKWEFVQDTFQLLRMQQHMFDEVRGPRLDQVSRALYRQSPCLNFPADNLEPLGANQCSSLFSKCSSTSTLP